MDQSAICFEGLCLTPVELVVPNSQRAGEQRRPRGAALHAAKRLEPQGVQNLL